MTKLKPDTTKIKREALMASIAIMVLVVLFICWAVISGMNMAYLVYALPYAIAIGYSYAVLKNKIKSEMLRRVITLLNVVGVGSVFLFLWVYVTLMNNYNF